MGKQEEFLQTLAWDLSISLALSLVLPAQSTWSTKHSFATTPTSNISWTTLTLDENLQMECKIRTALSLATFETLRARLVGLIWLAFCLKASQ